MSDAIHYTMQPNLKDREEDLHAALTGHGPCTHVPACTFPEQHLCKLMTEMGTHDLACPWCQEEGMMWKVSIFPRKHKEVKR